MGVYPLYVEPTPYNASELGDIGCAQSFDTIYMGHLSHQLSKFVRNDHDDWAFSAVTLGPTLDAPTSPSATATTPNTDAANSGDSYFPQEYGYCIASVNSDGQESRASSTVTATNDTELPRNYTTVSWTAEADAEYYRVYKQHEGGAFGWIGDTEGTDFVDDGFAPNYADAPINAYDPIGTSGNYPCRLGFWEQRLWVGQTTNNPNAAFASRSADFENFDVARPLRENDAIAIGISTGDVNAVEAFIPMERLIVGTSDNVMALRGANDDILVPNPPPVIDRQAKRGIDLPEPIVIGEAAFYQPRVEHGVRTLGYTFEADGYRSNDVSIFCPHLFRNRRIVRWAYAAEPQSAIYAVMDDGSMLCFTWEAEQQIWGWTEIDVGGYVEDVIAIPEGNESLVFIIVKRTINGSERRYVEQFGTALWTDYQKAYFLDCARGFSFTTATATITGLDHLEGEEVTILGDGQTYTGTVASGQVTIDTAVSNAIVGKPFDVLIETMALEWDPKKKITGPITTDVVESFDWESGRELGRLELNRTREYNEVGAPVMFTGKVEVQVDQVVDRDATIFIKQTSPYPFQMTGLYWDVMAK